MPERVDAKPVLSAIGAVLLLISLFLDWYDPSGTAWAVFEVWDLVLAVLALAALWGAYEQITDAERFPGRWFLPVGLAVALIVISQLVNEPPTAAGSDPDTGGWLALAGALLLTLAGFLSTARVSLAVVPAASEAETPRTATTRAAPPPGTEAPPTGVETPPPTQEQPGIGPEEPPR
jgi:hypothetical protein